MADTQEAPFSLMSLEDELTCSICLSTFHCPVTIPCGHNFCQDCLLATWKDSYSCPQCRTHFASRPELKKNTVLSSVVETLRSSRSEEPKDVIRCDTCMEAEASQTCLTCMASFCEEHLRPHRENPNFRVHQLSEPVGDLLERICPDHNKLMELFCSQHNRPICSLCLQVHKGCSFMTPEEQRSLKESELRDKLRCLDSKIEKTEAVMYQMKETQSKLKEGASKRKAVIAALYQHMRDILTQEERTAHVEVDCELELCHNKLRELTKRFTDNAETMRKAREDINSLLSQSQATAFLQASYDLPKVVKFDPYIPRVNLDSKKVTAIQAFANALNEHLSEMLTQPVEDRLPTMSPRPDLKADTAAAGEKVAPVSEPASSNRSGPQPEPERSDSPAQSVRPASHIPAPPPIQPYFQPVPVPVFSYMSPQACWNPPRPGRGASAGFSRPPPFRPAKPQRSEGQTTEKTVSKPVEQRQQGKTGGKPKTAVKQSDASRQTHHKSPAPGENKPKTTGSHFTKKDKPKSHNPGQAKGPHPGNKKK